MYSPKVSILVPVYGVEQYIEKCAQSLFGQTYSDIEYVFVNDCTKDRSIEVLRSVMARYPERERRVRIIEHAKNLGLAGARNTAVTEARGVYVLHMDSDDYLEPDAVEKLMQIADSRNVDIVAADMYWQFPRYATPFKHLYFEDKQAYLKVLISKKAPANVVGKLIRRTLYTDNHIEAPVGMNYGEDYCVYPRLVYFSNDTAYLPSPIYHYVQYNSGSYIHGAIEKNTDVVVQAISLLETFFRQKNIYDELKESFDLARLKVKVSALLLSSLGAQRRFAELFSDISIEQYKPQLSKREYMVLHMGRRNFFLLINVYRRLYIGAGKIKRRLKTLLSLINH